MTTQSLRERYPGHKEIPLLIVLSAALLGAGLCLPLMNVEKMIFWRNKYSVLTGIIGLLEDQEYFLSAILFFFCLVFPILKIIFLGIIWQFKCVDRTRERILKGLTFLGKWSMLDVFVVAILIVAVKLGPLASVKPQVGVYIFCLAILLSISTTAWVERIIQSDRKD